MLIKNYLLGMLLLVTIFAPGYSQINYIEIESCDNYNAYLNSAAYDEFKQITTLFTAEGIMRFDLTETSDGFIVDDVLIGLQAPAGSTFVLFSEIPSQLNDDLLFRVYDQYHNGIRVRGGGFTTTSLVGPDIPPGPGPDPCEGHLYMMTTSIVSGFQSESSGPGNVQISEAQLYQILKPDSPITSELIFVPNLLGDCENRLVWESYYYLETGLISLVDAVSGEVLSTKESSMPLTASTIHYGSPDLNNLLSNAQYSMISADGRVKTYDFNYFGNPINDGGPQTPQDLTEWTTDKIHTIPFGAPDWGTVAPQNVYQAHLVGTTVLPLLEQESGYNLGLLNTAVSNSEYGAVYLQGHSLNTSANYISLGEIGEHTTAQYETMAHELTHGILFKKIGFGYFGSRDGSLHEGIADMVGTYIESKIQMQVDWVKGDDVFPIQDYANPDPDLDCYDEVISNPNPHERSTPLSHWFYLVSEGGTGYQGIGIESAMFIVFDAMKMLKTLNDYKHFRIYTLLVVDEIYGACSPEGQAVRKAWHDICVGPDSFTDCFSIAGNPQPCEEGDSMTLWIDNPIPGNVYRWSFPIEWTVPGSNGNEFIGQTFSVTNFPDYPSYPKDFTIRVYSPSQGSEYTVFKRVRIRDCDGNGPNCNGVVDSGEYKSDDSNNKLSDQKDLSPGFENRKAEYLRVVDISGKTLYSGLLSEFDLFDFRYNGMLLMIYLDKEQQFIKTKKVISIE